MSLLVSIPIVLVMAGCVLLIPLGLPGLWLIAALTLGLTLFGQLPWTVGLGVAVATLLAEGLEVLILARFGKAFGGSRRAFWGAVLGGMIGLFVGTPVPVIGSIVTAFAGSFAGAALVTFFETRSVDASARVGWGVLLARSAAVAMKVAVAFAVIGIVGIALLFGGR
jgi:uncharacterized protein YqgC (DUF456 family)